MSCQVPSTCLSPFSALLPAMGGGPIQATGMTFHSLWFLVGSGRWRALKCDWMEGGQWDQGIHHPHSLPPKLSPADWCLGLNVTAFLKAVNLTWLLLGSDKFLIPSDLEGLLVNLILNCARYVVPETYTSVSSPFVIKPLWGILSVASNSCWDLA